MDSRLLHIDGFTLEEEMKWLYDTVQSLPANSMIVELGAWLGRTTGVLYMGAGTDKSVVSVDTWLGQQTMRDGVQAQTKHQDIFLLFMANMAYLGLVPRWFTLGANPGKYYLRMTSLDASLLFPNESIDMVFIDADHDSCEQDCHAWIPKVKNGGIVCGHDYSDGFPLVREAVDARFPEHKRVGSIWIAAKVIANMDNEGKQCKN